MLGAIKTVCCLTYRLAEAVGECLGSENYGGATNGITVGPIRRADELSTGSGHLSREFLARSELTIAEIVKLTGAKP